MREMLFKFE